MTHDEIMDALEHTASRIAEIAEKLTESQLQRRSADGHWSIKELSGHLRDAAEMYGERFRRIIAEDKPFLPAYDQDAMLAAGDYNHHEIGPIIGELDSRNKEIAALLGGLREGDWRRTGNHEENGRVVLEDIVQYYGNHLHEHLAEIDQRAREVASDMVEGS